MKQWREMKAYFLKELSGKRVCLIEAENLDQAIIGKNEMEKMFRERGEPAVLLLSEATLMELREFFAKNWCGKIMQVPID